MFERFACDGRISAKSVTLIVVSKFLTKYHYVKAITNVSYFPFVNLTFVASELIYMGGERGGQVVGRKAR